MSIAIYWFRNDLRLADNPAFTSACLSATRLLPVYCHNPEVDATTPWGFVRRGIHRRHFLASTLADLSGQLTALGSRLLELRGRPEDVLPALARAIGASVVLCEAIAAPEEEAEVTALRANGLTVTPHWQSSMLDPDKLPFAVERLPDVFTAFRQAVEKAGVLPAAPLPVPATSPALPDRDWQADLVPAQSIPPDSRSSFPYQSPFFSGGETVALAHLDRYFAGALARTYKATRNGLIGTDYSSKFSPWLASGAISARTAYAALMLFEARHGANDSTYWLWFELLWRDYFRFLHLKYGRRLYGARGLSDTPAPSHDAAAFERWCRGATSEPLVDAGMRELSATGYLSNRMRQVVSSYLVNDLECDWRAGAAWFESQLVDYDVYSNQGNWLYIAGRGTDPRGGRRFNVEKQAREHDPDGRYRALWGSG